MHLHELSWVCLSMKREDGGRRSVMGDSSKLLSHYHEDARTMYEVFQRGLHISGITRMAPLSQSDRLPW